MKVMLLMIANPNAEQKPPTDAALLAMHKFNEELEAAGVLVDLGGLTPPGMGVRVHYKGKKRDVKDGPFAEAKEMIAGFSILEVKSLAEAVEWAKRSPFGMSGDETEEAICEIRPLWDASMFDPPANG